MRIVTVAFFLAMCSVSALAQKERLFTGDPKNVFDVAVDVVKEHYEIEAVDREDMILHFRAPDRMRLNRYKAVAAFQALPRGCGKSSSPAVCAQVMVRLRISGFNGVLSLGKGNSTAKEFFTWIEERLAAKKSALHLSADALGDVLAKPTTVSPSRYWRALLTRFMGWR
jgi:hypothetical protein